jgi:3',5'-cyclic AMP phosphodiesterase CpdA
MPNPVADMFRSAAAVLLQDDRRRGNVLELSAPCEVVISGDLHGNRTALDKIIRYAALGGSPGTILILQELIHGPTDERSGKDRSIELLVRAVRLLTERPRQVLFLMGNHDLAQATGGEIMKSGGSVCKDFIEGVRYSFGEAAGEVMDAVNELLLAMPLAVRCPNALWVSHSLPSPNRMFPGVMDVLGRPYELPDLKRGGGAYEWTWGRSQTPEQIERLAGELKVEYFVVGHRHSEDGFEVLSPRCVAITSDGAAGCVIRLPCDRPLTAGSLSLYMKQIVSLP